MRDCQACFIVGLMSETTAKADTDCEACITLGYPCRAHTDDEPASRDGVMTPPLEQEAKSGDDGYAPPVEFAEHPSTIAMEQLDHIHVAGACVKNRYGLLCTPSIEPLQWQPSESVEREPQPGDWVLVVGQMHKDQTMTAGRNHAVRFESHNEHYVGLVRKDRVSVAPAPEDAPQCTHLATYAMDPSVLVRCTSRSGAGHEHVWESQRWNDSQTVGFFEVC